MSVSAGVGGTSVVGAVLGAGAATHTTSASPAAIASSLPFTGASHVMVMVAIALVLLVVGVLAVGLARRASQSESP